MHNRDKQAVTVLLKGLVERALAIAKRSSSPKTLLEEPLVKIPQQLSHILRRVTALL